MNPKRNPDVQRRGSRGLRKAGLARYGASKRGVQSAGSCKGWYAGAETEADQATEIVVSTRDVVAGGYLSLETVNTASPVAVAYSAHVVLLTIKRVSADLGQVDSCSQVSGVMMSTSRCSSVMGLQGKTGQPHDCVHQTTPIVNYARPHARKNAPPQSTHRRHRVGHHITSSAAAVHRRRRGAGAATIHRHSERADRPTPRGSCPGRRRSSARQAPAPADTGAIVAQRRVPYSVASNACLPRAQQPTYAPFDSRRKKCR
jgi:hypothetical protein